MDRLGELESSLMRAIKERRVLSLTYRDGASRIIEPHILYRDRGSVTCLGAFQRQGESSSGKETGWKTFRIKSIENLWISEEKFSLRAEFDSQDRLRYPTPIAYARRDLNEAGSALL